jgi:integrase
VGKRRKTWCYLYRFNGKARRMTLDNFPPMTVAEAHDAWRIARDTLRTGRDPSAAGAPKASTLFEDVLEDWLKRDQADNRSVARVRRRLTMNALPYLRGREIAGIGRRDILDILDRIADRGATAMPRQVYAHLNRLFAWAVERGIIAASPMMGMAKPAEAKSRDRVLSDDELVAVWNAPELDSLRRDAIRLLILTGARRSEIGMLRWDEIEGDAIHLSGERTKNGQPHVIPLSTLAKAILEAIPHRNDFVFGPIGEAWPGIRRKLGEGDWRLHDLRRTVATGLQKLGTALPVTESVLGHTAGSRAGVVGIYQRHDYADEKRSALEAWGAHVHDLVAGRAPGKVVALRR